MARFRVNGLIRIQSRGLYVRGTILEGTVQQGMRVRLASEPPSAFVATVTAIEYVLLSATDGRSEVALGVSFDDASTETIFEDACRQGTEIEVADC